jgi:hypothetical protein
MKITFTKDEFLHYLRDMVPAIYKADRYEVMDIETTGYPVREIELTLEAEEEVKGA